MELVQRADRVFHGKCLTRESRGENASVPIVEYTFEVKKAIKGVAEGERVVFRQVDGSEVGEPGIPGVPQYAVGQELVLFLKKESRRGLTSPVGLGQGAFVVKKNGRREAEVVNFVRNRNLLIGLSEADQTAIAPQEFQALKPGQPIPLSHFSSLVARVVRFDRTENRSR
ncbi:MAG: hypothetical protein EHM61_13330 [Acidobacteria bacterium]|nr:MAG: hypothetical protein EHM61_13330 [Acidobacteriota bacterium]